MTDSPDPTATAVLDLERTIRNSWLKEAWDSASDEERERIKGNFGAIVALAILTGASMVDATRGA